MTEDHNLLQAFWALGMNSELHSSRMRKVKNIGMDATPEMKD